MMSIATDLPKKPGGDCHNFRGHRGEAVVDENGTVPFDGTPGEAHRSSTTRTILQWLHESAGGQRRLDYAASALEWCHRLPNLADMLPATLWQRLLNHLLLTAVEAETPDRNSPLPLGEGQGVRAWVRCTNGEHCLSQNCPHPNPLPNGEGTGIHTSRMASETPDTDASLLRADPLVHQLLAGELAMTLASLFPNIKACRRLLPRAHGRCPPGWLICSTAKGSCPRGISITCRPCWHVGRVAVRWASDGNAALGPTRPMHNIAASFATLCDWFGGTARSRSPRRNATTPRGRGTEEIAAKKRGKAKTFFPAISSVPFRRPPWPPPSRRLAMPPIATSRQSCCRAGRTRKNAGGVEKPSCRRRRFTQSGPQRPCCGPIGRARPRA